MTDSEDTKLMEMQRYQLWPDAITRHSRPCLLASRKTEILEEHVGLMFAKVGRYNFANSMSILVRRPNYITLSWT